MHTGLNGCQDGSLKRGGKAKAKSNNQDSNLIANIKKYSAFKKFYKKGIFKIQLPCNFFQTVCEFFVQFKGRKRLFWIKAIESIRRVSLHGISISANSLKH